MTEPSEAAKALEQPLSRTVPDRIWLHDLGGGEITWCGDPDPDGQQIDAVEYIRTALVIDRAMVAGEPVAAPDTAALVSALEGWQDLHDAMIAEGGDLAELPEGLIEHFAAVQAGLMDHTRALIAQHKGTEHG